MMALAAGHRSSHPVGGHVDRRPVTPAALGAAEWQRAQTTTPTCRFTTLANWAWHKPVSNDMVRELSERQRLLRLARSLRRGPGTELGGRSCSWICPLAVRHRPPRWSSCSTSSSGWYQNRRPHGGFGSLATPLRCTHRTPDGVKAALSAHELHDELIPAVPYRGHVAGRRWPHRRSLYTVIGDPVNEAAHRTGQTRPCSKVITVVKNFWTLLCCG